MQSFFSHGGHREGQSIPCTAVADEGHGEDGPLSHNLTVTQTTRSRKKELCW